MPPADCRLSRPRRLPVVTGTLYSSALEVSRIDNRDNSSVKRMNCACGFLYTSGHFIYFELAVLWCNKARNGDLHPVGVGKSRQAVSAGH